MTLKHDKKRDINKPPESKGGNASLSTTFTLSNPEKILYPEDQITKQDLFNYYDTISDSILPYLSQRPLTLVRCPDHYSQCFYQRHYNESTPKALHAIEIKSEDSSEQYIYLNDKAGLLSLIQMGVLEIHPWGSLISHLEKPDRIIFDLDPGPNVAWEKVIAAAFDVKEQLEHYKLTSFVKSTGGKGLHVVIPIRPEYEWEKVKKFAYSFAQSLEKQKPNDYVCTISKEKRQNKIFIDYLRNQWAATAIANYSTRARIHAPIAIPLAWDELSSHREDNYYTIKTVLKRLSHLKEDPWHDFWLIKQSIP